MLSDISFSNHRKPATASGAWAFKMTLLTALNG